MATSILTIVLVVGTSNWVGYIAGKLPEHGYEPVEPVCVGYPALSILDDRDTEFADLVGERLMDKVVKHNFMVGISLYKDSCWIACDDIYHQHDCSVLLDLWNEVTYQVGHESIGQKPFKDLQPCEICKPKKP